MKNNKVQLWVMIVVDNVKYRTALTSDRFDSPDEAKQYADTLVKAGLSVGYRVIYQVGGTWYNHEHVHYLSSIDAAIPVYKVANEQAA